MTISSSNEGAGHSSGGGGGAIKLYDLVLRSRAISDCSSAVVAK